MPMSRPKIKHKPRVKAEVQPVTVRKIALGFADLAPALQADARRRFGHVAEGRVEVISRGQYRER